MMRRRASLSPPLLSMLVALGLAAPEARAQTIRGLTDSDRAAIDRTTQAYIEAVLAGDWAAVASLYTEEAVWMPPDAPAARNRPTIQANLEMSTGRYSALSIVPAEIRGMGGSAHSWGTYFAIRTTEQTSETVRDAGKYVVILERQSDGSWLIARHIWNSDLPPPK